MPAESQFNIIVIEAFLEKFSHLYMIMYYESMYTT